LHLLYQRQIEKRPGYLVNRGNEVKRHTMPSNDKKPNVTARRINVMSQSPLTRR
jgi:hypothetical protein